MAKRDRNYICLVDNHRRSGLRRNTAGRYRVGAKTKKEAKMFLQYAIGFGKVLVYYEDTDPETCSLAKRGQCYREVTNGNKKTLVPVRHANEQYKED